MKRVAMIAVLPLAFTVGVAACANDFDALFSGNAAASGNDGGKSSSSSSGSDQSSTSSSGTPGDDDDVSQDSGTVPPQDLPDPSKTCTPNVSPNGCGKAVRFTGGGDNETQTSTCTGCGCTCADHDFATDGNGGPGTRFECDDDICNMVCQAGTHCTNICGFEGGGGGGGGSPPTDCKLQATTAVGEFKCIGTRTTCEMTCDTKSICTLDCGDSETCSPKCAADSQCVITTCDPAKGCTVDCQGGVKTDCKNGTFTCNKACP